MKENSIFEKYIKENRNDIIVYFGNNKFQAIYYYMIRIKV